MICSKCRYENRTGAKYCEECGARLTSVCASCGAQLSATAKFCSECGHPAYEAASARSIPSPRFGFDAPQAYTPRHLVEKILSSRTALEGERKHVTALFADLKGSMELFADRDPEEARKLLDPVLDHMMEAVHRFEGTVNHVLGDGIVALFGAPLAHEDHAVRACYAALRMQEMVKRYSEDVRRSEGIPIQIRVGLNSGEVVVRSIGGDLRMDYTVVGQTTNVAARMEQLALPGTILMSADTLMLAEGYVQVKPLGPLKIKGLDPPLEVYEIVGASPVRSRVHAAAARGLTRFVGRDSELDQLRQALERAYSGHGQVLAVVGEPGVGKSRLYWEFTRSHRTHGWLIVETSSVSYGKATAFLPIIDLLRAYFHVEVGDEPRNIREKLTGKVLALDRALEPSLPALLWLLDVPIDDARWQQLDPSQRRQRALDAVNRLLLRESQVQPLLILLEDLHWIDAETQVLLDSLVESLPTARLLLLVNYRPEYQHGWSGKTYYQQLSINPLAPSSAEELLNALLGVDAELQPLKRMLIERTEGNPFFLEESVRTLVETKVLVGERGTYRLGKALQGLQIPATVQAMLAARIDRLMAEDKRLLQAAAVVGKDVPFALLLAIADLPEEGLRRGLAHLQSAEFLYEVRLFPDLEYTFKHALTHQVAYGSLLQGRRRSLHGQIAEAIEQIYVDQIFDHVERLAHHALCGEIWEKAVSYHRQAGVKAFARSANREALRYFEQALLVLTHLPETRDKLEQAIDIRFELRNALFPLAEIGRIEAHLRDAEVLARTLNDQRRLGLVSVYTSHNSLISGHTPEARAFAEDAQTIARTLEDLPLQVGAGVYLGAAYVALGDFRRAEGPTRNALALLQGDLIRERFGLAGFPAVMTRFYLVWALAERGEFAEGIVHGLEAIRFAESFDHPYSLTVAYYRLGFLYDVKGDFSQAVPLLQTCVAVASDCNIPLFAAISTECLGHVYTQCGRVEEGIALLHQALSAFEPMGVTQYKLLGTLHLGEAQVVADRPKDAVTLADRVLLIARERGNRGYEAWALRLLAEIASHPDHQDLATAEMYYGAALTLASDLEMRPLVAHCCLGLGKLHGRTGKREQSRDQLLTATTMYKEMNMPFWLDKAEVGLRQLEAAGTPVFSPARLVSAN